MKVIDLLNKIANGEIPKKIYYDDMYFTYDESCSNYVSSSGSEVDWKYTIMEYINDEVEIIEEDKEIELIPYHYNLGYINCGDLKREVVEELSKNFNYFKEKINELVKAVNELKKGK